VAYVRFLEMGGEIAFEELTPTLLKTIIDRGHPILAGLSATYLYRFRRERWDPVAGRLVDDDVAGDPTGHFVVISGYDHGGGRQLTVLDPSEHVPSPRTVGCASGVSASSTRYCWAMLRTMPCCSSCGRLMRRRPIES
jgi:hypothetical protein